MFFFSSQNPRGNPVWLESIAAIPAESFTEDFLQPEQVEGARDYAVQCGLNHFYINPEEQGKGHRERLFGLSSRPFSSLLLMIRPTVLETVEKCLSP